ncbi:MAG TPA: zf-HC2 domain-containing protein [Candidatus Baltobacteraceae bacterium]|jgi:hypothetical protein
MFERNAHVGEDAELYALGQLDASRRERLERHVRVCGECAHRVGEAEATVLRLIEGGASGASAGALRPFRARASSPTWKWAAAIAAAFVLGLLPWLGSMRSARTPEPQQLAMTALLNGHFQHAPFVADAPDAPAAKVIYARTGEWIYVLAAPGTGALSIVTSADGKRATVATLPPAMQTRAAFVPLSARIDEVVLSSGTRQLAHARVAFAKPR